MGYLEVFFAITVIIALTIYIRLCKSRRREVVLLILYLIGVLIITLFTRSYDADKQPILNPLYKYYLVIKRLYVNGSKDGIEGICRMLRNNEFIITELVLNILLFIPLGLLLPEISKDLRAWWKAVLAGLSLSLLIEVAQLFTHLGCFETVDLVNNSLGAWIGYGLFCLSKNSNHSNMQTNGQKAVF